MVLDAISGRAVTGRNLEKLYEVEDRAVGARGHRLQTNIGGQPTECFILYDKNGKQIRSGNDACLQVLDEAISRQSNPISGNNNTRQLQESTSI